MSDHPLDLSARILDAGSIEPGVQVNRQTQELSELGDRISMVESFSHAVAVDCGDQLVVFDASGYRSGQPVVEAIDRWAPKPISHLVYTHGHLDHVGGSGAFAAHAEGRGHKAPAVVGHANVEARFQRYTMTSQYNQIINMRQFGGAARHAAQAINRPFLPDDALHPDVTYLNQLTTTVGDTTFEFNHCMGETDDHTWTWIPEHRLITAGDQFAWVFPNCGNPQKVQRYPVEWAASLRAMAAKEPELFVPAHGLPIAGRQRIATCLDTVATVLETLAQQVIDAMNTGASLDEIVHSVTVPADTLALPFLRPIYDEPEFVVRNLWRLYGGWWDGNPARLKPASDTAIGAELTALLGGPDALTQRALALSEQGDHRMACQLIEFAAAGAADDVSVHEARARIYESRRHAESSLMAKGIYKSAAADSTEVVTGQVPGFTMKVALGTFDS